jgi:RNA polymerase sigma-70 factor (ECF subfamily)
MNLAGGKGGWGNDAALVSAILAGDEAAFSFLVTSLTAVLIRVAEMYVPSRAVAEEVVQEAWIAVLRGLDKFEGRSSLKTWVVNIVVNRAKTAGQKENRSLPFASAQPDPDWEGALPADRFQPATGAYPRHWSSFPRSWPPLPEEGALHREVTGVVATACQDLPLAQREVLLLRDVAGFASDEVCRMLGLSQANQRVLLHRARSKVRAALERYFDPAS